ncbi:MAG: cyclodeaminase/cyclohydrolase family protein [Lachnospiraceae bacterium]|nr:cyclodeaminase/cyclohydrolase family protein [Lachnospiraceae bacterium]
MEFKDYRIDDFLELLGSDAPAPGGGAAAALTGAIGMTLSEMVCSLTVTNPKFADQKEQTESWKQECRQLAARLLAAMDRDAEAFESMGAVFRMPKNTEEEKNARRQAMQEALLICVKPPMELMKIAMEALELTAVLVGHTTRAAISDLGVAAVNLYATVKGAWLNVLININSMKDTALAGRYRAEGEELLMRAQELSDDIFDKVRLLI